MASGTLHHRDYAKGVVTVLLATVFWSLSGLFVRTIPDANVWQVTAWRAFAMSSALLVFLLALYGRGTVQRFRMLDRWALVGLAGFFAVGSTLYIVSLTLTSVANVACLSNLAPIFAPVLARLVAAERTGPAVWLAAALAVIGVFVIFGTDFAQGSALGNALSLIVAFCFAGQTVWLRRYRDIDMVPAVCIGGFVVFATVAVLRGGLAVPLETLGLIALMGAVQLALPLILYSRAARWVPAVQLTLIALLDVILNPFWAWLAVGETPTREAFWGGGLIAAGVLVSVTVGRRPQPAAVPAPVGER
ncbi:MAG: DMT family transporter [Pseudomonadota bacterium]